MFGQPGQAGYHGLYLHAEMDEFNVGAQVD
jgi:hypothetical protein